MFYRIFSFTKFVQKILSFNMDIFFFILDLMKAVMRPKNLSEAENAMKESIYCKKFLLKVAHQP